MSLDGVVSQLPENTIEPVNVALQRTQGIAADLVEAAPVVAVALVVYFLFWGLGTVVRKVVIRVIERTDQPEHVARIFGRLARWVVLTFGLLVAVTIVFPSLTAQSLLSTLGIGGVAIGFAFRDIFTNLLSGLLLLLTRPFRIGDQIVSSQAEGTVEDIQMRATVVRTAANRRILIPNAELFTGRVQVNTAHEVVRGDFEVYVGLTAKLEGLLEEIIETVKTVPEVEDSRPPTAIVTRFTDSKAVISVRFWVSPPRQRDLMAVSSAVMTAVSELLQERRVWIDPPKPCQVYVSSEGAKLQTTL